MFCGEDSHHKLSVYAVIGYKPTETDIGTAKTDGENRLMTVHLQWSDWIGVGISINCTQLQQTAGFVHFAPKTAKTHNRHQTSHPYSTELMGGATSIRGNQLFQVTFFIEILTCNREFVREISLVTGNC